MSKMKNAFTLMAMGAMLSASRSYSSPIGGEAGDGSTAPPTPEEAERKKQMMIDRQKEIDKRNGLKEFVIDGVAVMAINEKNAKKKALKLKA